MKFQLKKSETSVILIVFIQDSSVTTGAGLGGLDQTSSITGGYVKRNGIGIALAVDENVTTEGTYEAPSTAGQVRIGTPANMPTGFYELHFHNDLFTTADYVTIGLGGASNMAPLNLEIQLVSYNPNDAVRAGLTALPNANADAAGGLPISDAGGLDLDTKLANTNEITAARMGALTDWINGGRLDLILDIIAADTTTDIPALIAALNNISAADVNAQCDIAISDAALATAVNLATVDTVVDAILAMLDNARTEPGQGAPPVNPDAMTKIDYLYKAWRNKKTQTSSVFSLFNDAGDTVDQKSTDSDNGTTATKGEITTGP